MNIWVKGSFVEEYWSKKIKAPKKCGQKSLVEIRSVYGYMLPRKMSQ